MIASTRRSGRITVMFAFLMTTVAVFLGLVLNLSHLLQTRTHLQICADAAAFSGAVQQARGLNRIARMNNQAADILEKTRIALRCYVFPNYDAGNHTAMTAEMAYKVFNSVNLARQKDINMSAAGEALRTAAVVNGRNEPQGVLTSYPSSQADVGRLTDATGLTLRLGFFYKQTIPFVGEVILYAPGRSVPVKVLRKSNPAETIYFCNQIKRPFLPWLFQWGTVQSQGVFNLRAYATAKPCGGSLWEGKRAVPHYETTLVQTGAVNPLPAIPDNWGYEW
jgi:hypothetical protein